MNTQSISSSLSLSQSFIKSFGSVNQAPKNAEMRTNTHAKSSVADSVNISDFNKAKESSSSMLKPNISFSRTESLNLQITTKEGDVVTIRFNRMEASHSGVSKMEQQGSSLGRENQTKAIKSELNVNIKDNSNKDPIKPASPSPTQDVVLNKPASTKPADVTPSTVKPTNVENTTNRLVANSKSELQIEQGGNKLNMTKEETYSFEPAKPSSIKGDLNKAEITDISSKDNVSTTPKKVVADTHSESPKKQDTRILNTAKEEAPSKTRETPNKNEVAIQQQPKNNSQSSSSNKIVASSRDELHINQGGHELKMTNEQTYSFEPTKRNNTSKSINHENAQNVTPQQSTRNDIKTNTPVEKTPSSAIPAEKVVSTPVAQPESSSSSLHKQQSISLDNNNGENYAFDSDFSLSIEGDLNAEEQQSIFDLLKTMSQVSHSFFQGDVNAAFSQAQNMGLETEQIAGFSMSLNNQKSMQAVTAYQQTKMPEQSINTDLLGQASDFLTQAKSSMVEAKPAIDSFAAPKQSFMEMFAGVGQMFSNDQDNQPLNNSGDMFLKVIESISNDLFSTHKNNLV